MDTLKLISMLVDALQYATSFLPAGGLVSQTIARRIAEGRATWTPAEEQAILDELARARAAAATAVDRLP